MQKRDEILTIIEKWLSDKETHFSLCFENMRELLNCEGSLILYLNLFQKNIFHFQYLSEKDLEYILELLQSIKSKSEKLFITYFDYFISLSAHLLHCNKVYQDTSLYKSFNKLFVEKHWDNILNDKISALSTACYIFETLEIQEI